MILFWHFGLIEHFQVTDKGIVKGSGFLLISGFPFHGAFDNKIDFWIILIDDLTWLKSHFGKNLV